MKIICAPDSFKESLSAIEAARSMANGVRRAIPDATAEIDECPVGDGGEGTMQVLLASMGGTVHLREVVGPLGTPVNAQFAITRDGRGVVELAQASGIVLVPKHQRDPMRATSYGTGELIKAAIEAGCRSIIVCLGGSATVDGGTGIAQALGVVFRDQHGQPIQTHVNGSMLLNIASVDRDVIKAELLVACDVNNPLCGPQGAAAIYGPQKGANAQQVRELDAGLAHLARVTGGDADVPGAGAAGGAGFGLFTLCNGRLERGIDVVLDAVRFDERCRNATLVLTGEGRLDQQSLHGKATIGVATAAARHGVPTIAIVGSAGEGAADCTNPSKGGALHSFISLTERFGAARAIQDAAACIEAATAEAITKQLMHRM